MRFRWVRRLGCAVREDHRWELVCANRGDVVYRCTRCDLGQYCFETSLRIHPNEGESFKIRSFNFEMSPTLLSGPHDVL